MVGLGGLSERVQQGYMQSGVPHFLDPLGHLYPTVRPTHGVPGPDRAAGASARLGVTRQVCL